MPLTLSAGLSGSLATSADLAGVIASPDLSASLDYLLGTASGQADQLYLKTLTLAASATQTLDLSGTLPGIFGANIAFARVYGLILKANAGNTNDVLLGNTGSNAFVGPFNAAADGIKVPPGGIFCVGRPLVGWTVTPGTGDLLKLTNGGAGSAVTFSLGIIGASA